MYCSTSIWGLPLLGESGGDMGKVLEIPPVTLDTLLSSSRIGIRRPNVYDPKIKKKIRRYGIDSETLPERVVIFGREEVYHASPCRSGTLLFRNIHYAAQGKGDTVTVKSLSSEVFTLIYDIRIDYDSKKTVRELMN